MAKPTPPKDLTTEILKQIRDEMRAMNGRLEQTNERLDVTNERLAAVETTVRDLAQQMLILGRAIKVSLDHRKGTVQRLDSHDRRLERLEKRRA